MNTFSSAFNTKLHGYWFLIIKSSSTLLPVLFLKDPKIIFYQQCVAHSSLVILVRYILNDTTPVLVFAHILPHAVTRNFLTIRHAVTCSCISINSAHSHWITIDIWKTHEYICRRPVDLHLIFINNYRLLIVYYISCAQNCCDLLRNCCAHRFIMFRCWKTTNKQIAEVIHDDKLMRNGSEFKWITIECFSLGRRSKIIIGQNDFSMTI